MTANEMCSHLSNATFDQMDRYFSSLVQAGRYAESGERAVKHCEHIVRAFDAMGLAVVKVGDPPANPLADPTVSPPGEQAFYDRCDAMAAQAQRREQIRLMFHTLTNWSLVESQREAARAELAAIMEKLERKVGP